MKRIQTWLTVPMVAVVVLFGVVTASAQSRAPVATVAVASFDDIQSQAKLVGELVGVPVDQLIQQSLSTGPAAVVLKYFDTTLPMGGCVYLVDGEPIPVGMVPFDLEGFLGDSEIPADAKNVVEDNGDGTYLVKSLREEADIVVKQVGKWLYVSTDAGMELVGSIDPVKLLGKIAQRYTICVKLNAAAVPTSLKDELFAQIEAGMNLAMDEQATSDNPIMAVQANNTEQSIEQLKMLFYETSQVLVGLKLSDDHSFDLDIALTAMPNTKMAGLISGTKPISSRTFGLIPENAVVAFWQSAEVSDEVLAQQRQQITNMFDSLDQLIDAVKPEIAKEDSEQSEFALKAIERCDAFLTVLREKSEANISSESDGMFALTTDMGSPAFVAAGVANDTEAVLAIVDEIYQAASDILGMVPRDELDETEQFVVDTFIKEFASAEVQESDGLKYRIVGFDFANVPAEDSEESQKAEAMELMTKIWGTTKVESGIASTDDGIVYAALSGDALKTLKSLVKESSAQPPKGLISGGYLALAPFMKYVDDTMKAFPEAADPEFQPIATQILAILNTSAGKDKIRFSARPITNGSMATISVDEGVLRIIGTFAMMGMQQGGMGGAAAATATDMGDGGFSPQMTDEDIEELIEQLELTDDEAEEFRQQMKDAQ